MENHAVSENLKPIISEDASKRITSLRFLLIVFVVFIHTMTPDDSINFSDFAFAQPVWVVIIKSIVCRFLGGASVPLFFFVASFLQFSKNDEFKVLLKKVSKSLLLPYVLWTCLVILLFFIGQSIGQTQSFFSNPVNIVKNWNDFDWLKAFTYHNFLIGLKTPLLIQFWFLRELMIFIILSPLLKFLCDRFPGLMLVLISVVAIKDVPLFFTVSTPSFFFYMAGFYCAKYKIDVFKIADKLKLYEHLILLALAVTFSFVCDGKYDFGLISTIISCLFFLKLSSYFVKNEKIYSVLSYLSHFSFFLYAVHAPFIITAVNKITQRLIPMHGFLLLIQFLTSALLTILIGTLIGIGLRKFLNPLFLLLNGGRR